MLTAVCYIDGGVPALFCYERNFAEKRKSNSKFENELILEVFQSPEMREKILQDCLFYFFSV